MPYFCEWLVITPLEHLSLHTSKYLLGIKTILIDYYILRYCVFFIKMFLTQLWKLPFPSGRTHQLRVHCSAIGHPIVGDFTYSSGADDAPYRMMLHAHLLHIPLELQPLLVSAGDPFLPTVDPKWLPQRSLRTLMATVEALLGQRVEEDRRIKEEERERVRREEEKRKRSKGHRTEEESEEQRRQCQEWLSEWAGDWWNLLYDYLF